MLKCLVRGSYRDRFYLKGKSEFVQVTVFLPYIFLNVKQKFTKGVFMWQKPRDMK